MCLWLHTIKVHSKIDSNTTPLHWIAQVVNCALRNLRWLSKFVRYWQESEHVVVYAYPKYPKHVQCLTYLVSMLATQELGFLRCQELCTQLCNMRQCIMRWWTKMNGTTTDLRISSPQLRALIMSSIKHTCVHFPATYSCPYRNPTTTIGHNVDSNSSPTIHHDICQPSALYSENWN